jgi:hypothetical protein
MIGVNCNGYDAKKLRHVMDKEKLNWRSFADSGAINASWNAPGTPTYYVIDHNGVIRYKWVFGSPGEKAIDAALDKLIEEVEVKAKNTPK